ncbi:MAG: hypothetical protein ACRDQ7_13460 [Haloechinothrix sp.]
MFSERWTSWSPRELQTGQHSRLDHRLGFAEDPENLLDRAQLLNSVGGDQFDALENLRRARIERANLDAAAREALNEAERQAGEADSAARAAYTAAIDAKAAAGRSIEELLVRENSVKRQFAEAQHARWLRPRA